MAEEITTWRTRIDAIDAELVKLVNERAKAASAIGKIKRSHGQPVFVPHREQDVYDRLANMNPGPLDHRQLRSIWREIMSASRRLEEELTVCHFGRAGSFTHQAARLRFGDGVKLTGIENITGVFSAVERGDAEYGVVPIENSTDGSITDTIDAFLATTLVIVAEARLRIRHHLMAKPGPIRRVYSRATVFSQCRSWIASHLPNVELVEVTSTTLAAEKAAAEEGAASIGPIEAGQAFGLPVQVNDIEDNLNNITRFVALGRPEHAARPTGNDKTSLMFAVKDRSGALFDALQPFHTQGISLSRIESRPNRRSNWEYHFFIDIMGHQEDPAVQRALAGLESVSTTLQILGSYPRSEEPLNG